jgi:ribosomal protein L21
MGIAPAVLRNAPRALTTQHQPKQNKNNPLLRATQVEPGSKIRFGRVLALKQGGQLTVGKPYLEGAAVEAEVLEELKAPKVIVYKMRPKKHYRRKNGHRQPLSKFMVTRVG